MKNLTQAPIFNNAQASVYDRAAEADKASQRSDQLGRDMVESVNQGVRNINEQRKIQRDALNAATSSVGELQAKAHFQFQDQVNQEIHELEKYIAEYKGDRTSPEIQSEMMRRKGQIKNMNARSSGIVSAIDKVKTEFAENPRYNKEGLYSSLDELLNNPNTLKDYTSIQEQIDKIKGGNLNMRAIAKEKLSKYEDQEIEFKGTTNEGTEYSKYGKAKNIFNFNKKGEIEADMSGVNLDELKRKDPEFVSQLLRMGKESIPEQVITDSSMTEDDIIKDQLKRLYEDVGQSSFKNERNVMTDLEKSEKESEINKNNAEGKESIDWNSNYNKFFAALSSGKVGDASGLAGLTDKSGLKLQTKKEYIQEAQNKLKELVIAKEIDQEQQIAYEKLLREKTAAYGDDQIMGINYNGINYDPSEQGIKTLYTQLVNTNFPKRREEIVGNIGNLDREFLEQGSFMEGSLLSAKENMSALMNVVRGEMTKEQRQEGIRKMLNTRIDDADKFIGVTVPEAEKETVKQVVNKNKEDQGIQTTNTTGLNEELWEDPLIGQLNEAMNKTAEKRRKEVEENKKTRERESPEGGRTIEELAVQKKRQSEERKKAIAENEAKKNDDKNDFERQLKEAKAEQNKNKLKDLEKKKKSGKITKEEEDEMLALKYNFDI